MPTNTTEPLPVRMLNEYAYCLRLFHLMHVDGRWDDNLYTDEGRSAHKRVDAEDDALPLYVQEHWLVENGVPIVHLSMGHWFYGITQGEGLRNAYDRAAQFAAAADDGRRLRFAQAVVSAKAQNQRTLLRRNGGAGAEDALESMRRQLAHVEAAADCESLLGIEGSLAASYFGVFSLMLTAPAFAASFAEAGRNRRPPRDPVNAMLSFGYALLAKECTVALLAEGLDPWWGVYLVSYDVADDKRRTRVFKLLRDTGDRVQYSVFCCQLNPRELHALKEAVRERLHREEDQTLFLDAGVVDGQRPDPLETPGFAVAKHAILPQTH
ncbi:MAG: CRISPR-associated endonuclease Cas1 [Kiritimatiellia bacterium]